VQYFFQPAHPCAGPLHFREQHCALDVHGLPPCLHAIGIAGGIEYDGFGRPGTSVAKLCVFITLRASGLVIPTATVCDAPANLGPSVNTTKAKMIAASAAMLLMVPPLLYEITPIADVHRPGAQTNPLLP
jgi:hypothetical protein